MKKIVVICLIVIFALGNICYAQDFDKQESNDYYSIGAGRVDDDAVRAPDERHSRDRHRSHHQHRKHHRHHDDNDDCEDIIKGIIILGIVKEILD